MRVSRYGPLGTGPTEVTFVAAQAAWERPASGT